MNNQLYVIIQAGGRGSRLRHHTWNKPKCLVSYNGKPILYHIFDYFKYAHFIIIGDYQFDVIKNYIEFNVPNITYNLIETRESGTASGIKDAFELIPESSNVVLMWSDIIINSLPEFSSTSEIPTVCTTSSFTCRWSISPDGVMSESPSSTSGIPGIFYFPKKSVFSHPPNSGEFVKWFSKNIDKYDVLECNDINELGDFVSIEDGNNRLGFCRFFNNVIVKEDTVEKHVIDSRYFHVHEQEVDWYSQVRDLGFKRIPNILNKNPLIMQRLVGSHPFDINDLSLREKRSIVSDILESLSTLHSLNIIEPDIESAHSVYIKKTIDRVKSVSKLLPYFEKDSITINGKKCQNLFSRKNENKLDDLFKFLQPSCFTPIHGDPTFSNIIVDQNLKSFFIDPRGSFCKPGIYGDPYYDFAKVYYSAVGSYDIFNRKKFKLYIDSQTVEVLMDDTVFKKPSEDVFNYYFGADMDRIKILHALIWLSLTGYSLDDLDSIMASFYMGLFWMEL